MGPRGWFHGRDDAVEVLLVVGILAAFGVAVVALVAGTFVTGVEPHRDRAPPTVAFSYHVEGSTLEVVYDGGEAFAAGRALVAVNGEGESWAALDPDVGADENVTVGDSVTVTGVAAGDTVTIRWRKPGSDDAVVVGRHEVP